jgi:hypothetical protein
MLLPSVLSRVVTRTENQIKEILQYYNLFKNRSCQGLLPNPCCNRGHPKNCIYNTIWLVLIFLHPFWAVQHRANFSKNDGLHHRWSGRCVFIHGRLTSRVSGLANTPPPFGGFFTALAANGLAINLEKCVFTTPSLEILGHRISMIGAAPTITPPKSKIAHPLKTSNNCNAFLAGELLP